MTIEQTPEQRARVEEFQRKHRIVLLTLLFTDVVGSTRLKQMLGERAAIALTERHHALLRELLARFADAEEIDTAGDSFFMVFAKPSDAVQFALLAQRAVRKLARDTGQPVLDRIGIHVGEVFIQDRGSERRNLFGIQIDSTARIMSLGDADQILLSRFAFDNARLVLRGFEMPGIGELSWLNHGYYELKGVEEPLEVCEVGEAGLAALTPPCDSEKTHRFHAADAEPVLGWRPATGQLVPETRWKLDRPLGQGGFGEVWLAQHETLKQRRVLKFCFKAERARALKREATLFRVLRERFGEHPNIVAIHDVFFDAPPFYLVTDFVDGPSLDRWTGAHTTLAETPLEQRLELVAQIADALRAAHDSGIIHRDVKPSNILIADPAAAAPRAKLVDFGIGQVVNAEALASVTKLGFTHTMFYTGSGTGTRLYQAPELLAGQPATTRSDIYSLGVLLWQIVLGDFTRPLATDWADEIADSLLREDIRHCVAGDPGKRFAAAELATRLRALPARYQTFEAEVKHRADGERRTRRRGLARAAAITACAIVVVAALAIRTFRGDKLRPGAEANQEMRDDEQKTQWIQRAHAILSSESLDEMQILRAELLCENIMEIDGGDRSATELKAKAEAILEGMKFEKAHPGETELCKERWAHAASLPPPSDFPVIATHLNPAPPTLKDQSASLALVAKIEAAQARLQNRLQHPEFRLAEAEAEARILRKSANDLQDSKAMERAALLGSAIGAEKERMDREFQTAKPRLQQLLASFQKTVTERSGLAWENSANDLKTEIERVVAPLDYHQDEEPYSSLFRQLVAARRRPEALIARPLPIREDITDKDVEYKGKVGNYDATFYLKIASNNRVTGNYTLTSGKIHLLRLEGTNPSGILELDEFTGEKRSAHIRLTRSLRASEIRWEGTMRNLPPDNRVLPVYFSRPR